jgi:AbrB family looped-hinge helix DNA binding protein
MPIAVITSKGQMTLPKTIRESLSLNPADRVALVMEGDHAILYPLRGTILDAAASVKSPAGKRPLDFHAVRKEVRWQIARRAAARGR